VARQLPLHNAYDECFGCPFDPVYLEDLLLRIDAELELSWLI
jgi:hypothetical protein